MTKDHLAIRRDLPETALPPIKEWEEPRPLPPPVPSLDAPGWVLGWHVQVLFIGASWFLVLFNVVLSGICIRDQLFTTYTITTPLIQMVMSTNLLITLGGIAAIHKWLLSDGKHGYNIE